MNKMAAAPLHYSIMSYCIHRLRRDARMGHMYEYDRLAYRSAYTSTQLFYSTYRTTHERLPLLCVTVATEWHMGAQRVNTSLSVQ